MDGLDITSSDLAIPVDDRSRNLVQRFEQIADEAIQRRDLEFALNACSQLQSAIVAGGIALSRVLYKLQKNMHLFGFDDLSDFWDEVAAYLGRSAFTLRRYAMVWEVYELGYFPKEIEPRVKALPISVQMKLASAARMHDFTVEEWNTILNAGNVNDMRLKIYEITERPLRRQTQVLVVKRNGDLYIYQQNKEPFFVGYLDINSENPEVRHAADTLIKRLKHYGPVEIEEEEDDGLQRSD
ncbi:hypothetical protein D6833_10995 [Candidatus Parcubacteria bacterium]|nr:MAG: hypothetical protein D6833_10995 [Candidatus Parcubacteria bacterium]